MQAASKLGASHRHDLASRSWRSCPFYARWSGNPDLGRIALVSQVPKRESDNFFYPQRVRIPARGNKGMPRMLAAWLAHKPIGAADEIRRGLGWNEHERRNRPAPRSLMELDLVRLS